MIECQLNGSNIKTIYWRRLTPHIEEKKKKIVSIAADIRIEAIDFFSPPLLFCVFVCMFLAAAGAGDLLHQYRRFVSVGLRAPSVLRALRWIHSISPALTSSN